jgi:hypothetical protein
MHRYIWLCVFVVVYFFYAPVSYAQITVWLSNNATFTDLDITTAAPPGTTGTFDIWVKTQETEPFHSVSVDLMSMGSAIELTGADIVIGRGRFGVLTEPNVASDGSIITDISAIALPFQGGTGIGPEVPVDDTNLEAYRFATIHYRIAGQGISELQLKVGGLFIGCQCSSPYTGLHLGIDDPFTDNVLKGGTDTIIDGRIRVVPEPQTVVLFVIGAGTVSTRRRKRRRASCPRKNGGHLDRRPKLRSRQSVIPAF